MAEQADTVAVDIGPAAQIGESGHDVVGQVGVIGGVEMATGAADTAIVGAQHRVSGASECIGQQEKGFVARDLLVAILRSAAGDQDDRRIRSGCTRQREGAGDGEVAAAVSDIFGTVGPRWLRFLRSRWSCHLATVQCQRRVVAGSGEGSGDVVAGPVVATMEDRITGDARNREYDGVGQETQLFERPIVAALRGNRRGAAVRGEGYPDRQLIARCRQHTVPVAGQRRRAGDRIHRAGM